MRCGGSDFITFVVLRRHSSRLKKKTDVKTIQRSLRHAENTTTLDKYVQTDMAELVAAQELMFDAIFQNRSAAVT
jgi:hypothetical protein